MWMYVDCFSNSSNPGCMLGVYERKWKGSRSHKILNTYIEDLEAKLIFF
jgi:hypothetical protein